MKKAEASSSMKKIWGNFLFGIAKGIDTIIGILISALSVAVRVVENIRQFVFPIIGCFGFFFVGFIIIPLFNRKFLTFLMILMIFPLLGRTFVNFLQYGRYVLTEYLYDKADYYRLGKADAKNFSDYRFAYQREKMKAEQEERERQQRAQAQYWENIFNDFFSQSGFGSYEDFRNAQNSQNFGGYHSNTGYGYGSQGGYQGYQNQQNAYNPFEDFNSKYEEACDTLGVPYQTDEYQVKLAYRKMAKKYHPDINPSPDATKLFQKVNAAYEFLSKENIDRYKRMK